MHRINDPKFLISRWKLQGNALDAMGRYNGSLVNTPTWAEFYKNNLQAIELNGNNQYVNVGDVAELNTVSQFSICFWMNQDVVDVIDWVFTKDQGDNTNRLIILTHTAAAGTMFIEPRGTTNRASFVYTDFIKAGQWHHFAMIFDGTQAVDTDRLLAYVDGEFIPLAYTGTIPTETGDTSGEDATIGLGSDSFDGKLHDFRIYNVPLTQDEILKLMHSPVPTY